MMKRGVWQLLDLQEEEKIIALLACHQILSINDLSDDFLETDYLETAMNLEILLEKKYVQSLGRGRFELADSDKNLKIVKVLREKIVNIIDEKLLDLSESKKDIDITLDLFSAIDKLWGNWLRSDIPETYSFAKKKIRHRIEDKLKTVK